MANFQPSSEFDNKFINERRNNTKSDLIEITEDKLENILLKHLNKLKKVQAWITPLSLFATILIVILTADFKSFLTIEKEVWKAIFVISLIASLIWLIITTINAIRCSKDASISFLINIIKNNQDE